MSKHTPGPWFPIESVNAETQGLHLIWSRSKPNETGVLIARTCFAPQSEANARLIAAAPELLEACRRAIDWLDELGCDCGTDEPGTCAVCIVRAAIQKAGGRI